MDACNPNAGAGVGREMDVWGLLTKMMSPRFNKKPLLKRVRQQAAEQDI